jgi:hypothetical protein
VSRAGYTVLLVSLTEPDLDRYRHLSVPSAAFKDLDRYRNA